MFQASRATRENDKWTVRKMRCKEQYRENWEEYWGVGGSESKVDGVETRWALKVQEKSLTDMKIGSQGWDSGNCSRGPQLAASAPSAFKAPTQRVILGWGRGRSSQRQEDKTAVWSKYWQSTTAHTCNGPYALFSAF